jgi:HK97 family phage portal protein
MDTLTIRVPSVVRRFSEGFSNALKRTVGPLRDDISIMRSIRQMIGYDSLDSINMQPYADSVWTYASIRLIAKNLAKVPANLVSTDKEEAKITSGDVYDLWQNPNMYMTTKQFLESVSTLLNIYGESIIAMKRKNIAELPEGMFPLNPSKFDPVMKKINDNDVLVGWVYTGTSPVIPFATHQIFFPKYFNPYDNVRGMSPLRAAKLSIDQHYFSAVYNKNFFRQGVRTSGFITVEGELSDESFNRILSQFEENNAGVNKAHKVALIEGGSKFTESKFTQKDMEFIQLNKLSRTEIFAALGTNEVVLGIFDAVQSYEGMRQADKQFWQECMVPHILYVEEFFNENLFKKISGGKIKLKFDMAAIGALHDDFSTRITTAATMARIGFPLNDINKRLELGMPSYKWGDTWFVPWGAIPVEHVMNPPQNQNPNDPNALPPAAQPKPKPAKEADDELSRQMWNRYLSGQMIVEDMMRNKVKRYLFEQRKTVIEAIAKNKISLFDIKREQDKLQRLLGSLYVEIMRMGAKMIMEELDVEESESTVFDIETPEVIQYLQIRLSIIPVKLLEKINEHLEHIFDSDSSNNMKAEEVRILYNKLARGVNVIARNESSSVLVVGRIIQMQRLGIRFHKWISSRRVTNRESHLALNNKVVRIGDSFMDGITLRYPGDLMAPVSETSGCTCFTIAYRESKSLNS